jgi:8-oxo-dGTP diphosphatase
MTQDSGFSTDDQITKTFGNKVRVRVSGLLIKENKILLVKHKSLGKKGIFWAPPGGGLNFGESAEESLKREFIEETGMKIEVKNFLFVYEFLKRPLHAIELFFLVEHKSGKLKKGKDPELSHKDQIIIDIGFFSITEIKKMEAEVCHGLFGQVNKMEELKKLKGFYANSEL